MILSRTAPCRLILRRQLDEALVGGDRGRDVARGLGGLRQLELHRGVVGRRRGDDFL